MIIERISVKTPDYVLIEDYVVIISNTDRRVIPVGSFVQPIDEYYLPKHIKDSDDYKFQIGPSRFIWAYTRYGIVRIPKSLLRRV